MNEGAAQILAALRRTKPQPCSGESLSQELGVSRAQVWKHVKTLRALGYQVAGEPGEGYRLLAVPDRLYPEEIDPKLHTRWLARKIHWFESLDSTNRVALDLARSGAAHGTAVIAEGQTAGRGRLGRSFFSPSYQSLYTSVVLRPLLSTAEAPTTILAAAIAVADSVATETRDEAAVELKWPNDVLLEGRKVSGILMEMGAEASRVGFLILGIGVNLNVEGEAFPAEFRASATSVRAHMGHLVDRVAFAARLYDTLEEVLDRHAEGGFGSLRPRFVARFRTAGRRVRVTDVGGEETEGDALGVDGEGALLVRRDDGQTQRVVAGDVALAKERNRG
jgi:BirA family biotin operon repressor/biotin-[acetyl-CoA-carboxylase] ligase